MTDQNRPSGALRQCGRVLTACLALLACGSGLVLSSLHPHAAAATTGVLTIMLLSAWRPTWWLFLLPVLLPVLSFVPWTGWWLLDESDLLVLALAAGAYARWSLSPLDHDQGAGVPWWLWSLLLAGLGWGVWRGLVDAGFDGTTWTRIRGDAQILQQGLYASYDSGWNTLRVGKSLVWGLLLLPLLRMTGAREGANPVWLLSRGMVVGLTLVCLVVVWERLVYVGLFEFDLPYRTTAWFWEMHVGGGAIDAYLAMAAPFAFWAMWSARSPVGWIAANLLLWATVYAVLTTYSRGVYLAVLIALVFMAVTAWTCRIHPVAGQAWGRRGMMTVLAAVALQGALVLGGGSFMADRLSHSGVDLVGRVTHWLAGVSLLKDRADLALGLGIGRLPTRYSQNAPNGEFSGRAHWQAPDSEPARVALAGPATREELLGLFALTQRVRLEGTGSYRARLRVRADGDAGFVVSLCQRHLLYDYQCQWQYARVEAADGGSRAWLDVPLDGDAFGERGWREALRGGVLAIGPTQVNSVALLESVELFDPQGRQVLANTDFTRGMQHWFIMARGHFLPWHMDNLYLEVLIERGLLGALVLGVLAVWAGRNALLGLRNGNPQAWVLSGSLLGIGVLGMVISVTEMPRIALLLLLILFTTSRLTRKSQYSPSVTDCN